MSAHIIRRCICPTAFCPLRFPAYSSDCSHASGSGALRSVSFCLHTARSRPEQRRTGLNPAFLSVVVGLGNNTWDSPFVCFLLKLENRFCIYHFFYLEASVTSKACYLVIRHPPTSWVPPYHKSYLQNRILKSFSASSANSSDCLWSFIAYLIVSCWPYSHHFMMISVL